MKKKLLVAVFITTILGNSMIVSAGFTPMYKPVSVKIPEIHVELPDGVKDAVAKGELYIAKCHLCHQTGRVWLIDENLEEVKLDNI